MFEGLAVHLFFQFADALQKVADDGVALAQILLQLLYLAFNGRALLRGWAVGGIGGCRRRRDCLGGKLTRAQKAECNESYKHRDYS